MKYYALPADKLTSDHLRIWSDIQLADPALDSPYFRPEFTQAVAAIRPGCEVAILEKNGDPVGFLPFHRSRMNLALPVADTLTDFQGIIARPGVDWDLNDLLRGCRLGALHMDHLLASQAPFRQHYCNEAPSPYMDLSQGFEAYCKNRLNGKSDDLKQTQRKARKCQREVGLLRLEALCTDPAVFDKLIEWKTAQYMQTRSRNVFATKWTAELLRSLIRNPSEHLRGVLSAIFIGDRLAAVHMGMISHGVLHWWFPTYNIDLRHYSPGSILLIEMARAAESLGIKRIDLGKGPEAYKTYYMSGATPLGEAYIDRRLMCGTIRRAWIGTREAIKSSRLERPARFVVFNARRLLGLNGA